MHVYWISKTGLIKREKVKSNVMLFQAIDGGYHPISHDAVFRDRDRKEDSSVTIFQGVVAPFGSSTSKEEFERTMLNVYLARRAYQKVPTSKAWARALARFFGSLVKYLPFILIAMVVGYAFLSNAGNLGIPGIGGR